MVVEGVSGMVDGTISGGMGRERDVSVCMSWSWCWHGSAGIVTVTLLGVNVPFIG